MISIWKIIPLAEVVDLHRGFELASDKRIPGPYPVLSAGTIAGSHSESRIKGPGFAIGRATNLGVPVWSDSDFWPLNTTLYASDFKGNDPRWLYHLFQTMDLSGYDSGSVQPMLNRNYISDIPISVPPIQTQHAIAEVLSALDDKIAANSRTMLISQQLIMSMYQSLPTEGGAHLQDITVVRKNKSEPEEIEPNETYIGLEHLTRRSIWANKTGIGSDATSTKSIFHTGDTLFGKLRPYFHKVAIAPTSGVCSTDILVLSPTINELSPLVLAAANDDATVERAVQNSNGTRMPRAKWADISTTPVPNPDATETKHFCAKADELIDLCRSLIVESRTLAATRDELLPLLMSGKITVADAEKRIAE